LELAAPCSPRRGLLRHHVRDIADGAAFVRTVHHCASKEELSMTFARVP